MSTLPIKYEMTDTRHGVERSFTEEFFVDRSPANGPGWYVFGRCKTVSANVIKIVARPAVPRRRHPHYNIVVQRGWKRKYEAQEVADALTKSYKKSGG